MSTKFGYIKQQAATKIVPYLFHQLRAPNGVMVARVENLGETNAGFMAGMIASADAKNPPPKPRDGSKPIADVVIKVIADDRAEKRELLAKHAVRDLENVFYEDGTAATKDDIEDFVMSLPDDVIEALWRFCNNANNFRDYPIIGEVKALAEK